MKPLLKFWADGFDFFVGSKWSHWTRLHELEAKGYKFDHSIIWLTRYLVTVPLLFLPGVYLAMNGVAIVESIGTTTYLILWLGSILVLYPIAFLRLYLELRIIELKPPSQKP